MVSAPNGRQFAMLGQTPKSSVLMKEGRGGEEGGAGGGGSVFVKTLSKNLAVCES